MAEFKCIIDKKSGHVHSAVTPDGKAATECNIQGTILMVCNHCGLPVSNLLKVYCHRFGEPQTGYQVAALAATFYQKTKGKNGSWEDLGDSWVEWDKAFLRNMEDHVKPLKITVCE